MTSIMAKFMWIVARVDSRQYRQNSTELQPERFWVGVEVPVTEEYIFNAKEILKVREAKATAELGYDAKLPIPDEPTPIYTAKALQFCLDHLGEYLHDPDDVKVEDLKPDEDWGDTSTEPTKVEGVDTEIDWSDDNSKKSTTDESSESWGEDEEQVSEIWDEDKETWE